MIQRERLAQDIKELRHRRRLRQVELARRIGRTQARVSELEGTRFDPRLSTLLAVLDALDAELLPIPRESVARVRQLIASPPIAKHAPHRDVFEELFVPSESEDEPTESRHTKHGRKR